MYTGFEVFEIMDITEPEEQDLLVRLFKRFFFKTIEFKYGFMKASAADDPEISANLFCSELELNPNILKLFGVMTTFKEDAPLSWI